MGGAKRTQAGLLTCVFIAGAAPVAAHILPSLFSPLSDEKTARQYAHSDRTIACERSRIYLPGKIPVASLRRGCGLSALTAAVPSGTCTRFPMLRTAGVARRAALEPFINLYQQQYHSRRRLSSDSLCQFFIIKSPLPPAAPEEKEISRWRIGKRAVPC